MLGTIAINPDDWNVQVVAPKPNPLKLGIHGWGLFACRDIQEGEIVTLLI